jgi:hypothetical protein
MAKIIEEGCIVRCGHCNTQFSFAPSEVGASFRQIPAGYSPEEEAYEQASFHVSCPKCHASVNVGGALGPEGKRFAESRARENRAHGDNDL